jgi:hypothetical protein
LRVRPRGRGVDAAVVGLLFVISAWWGSRQVIAFVERGGNPSFYQHYFEPAVMLACDRGFTVAEGPRPAPLDDFLFRRADAIDCSQLPGDLVVGTRNVYQYGWFYLMTTVGLTWKVVGVSWSGLAPLFGVLFGIVVCVTYALFRTAVPWPAALIASTMIAISPLHLQNLPHLRDYAKAPFVLTLILILFVLVRRPMQPRSLLLLAAAYGAILGVGYGFRTDLLANIPPFVVTLLLFMPGGVVRGFAVRAGAVLLAAAVFLITSWPAASYVAQSGGCQWHAVLLGLSDIFSDDLRVTSSFYDWMPVFSDEYVHTAVNSYASRVDGAAFIPYCSAAYDAASASQLRDIVMRVPADTVARAYGSTLQVLDLPFFLWREGWESHRGSSLGAVLHAVAGTARLAAVVTVVLLGAVSLRLGLFALCVVLYFGGYPSMQFADRHFFHLEFLGWWAIAFVAWHLAAPWLPAAEQTETRDWRRVMRGAVQFAALALALVLIPLWGLRAYQQREMARLIGDLLNAPRLEVPMITAGDGRTLDAAPDALAIAGEDQRQAAYLDVHIDLATCPEGIVLKQRYDSARPPYDFSGPIRSSPARAPSARILLPVFRFFRGFTIEQGSPSCVSRVARLQSIDGRRLLPVLTLSAGWQTQPFYRGVRPLASLGRVFARD